MPSAVIGVKESEEQPMASHLEVLSHVSNNIGNDVSGDAEQLLSRCRPWPVIEAIKDGAFRTDTVEDVCHYVSTQVMDIQPKVRPFQLQSEELTSSKPI